MKLTKEGFVAIVQSVGVPAREGESYLDDAKVFPKIAYWEYVWTDEKASGEAYETHAQTLDAMKAMGFPVVPYAQFETIQDCV